MSYYNACRKHQRSIRKYSRNAVKHAEKRRDLEVKLLGDPMQALRLHGQPCRIQKNRQLYETVESEQGLIAWKGKRDHTIDKYDCRSLLDHYRDYQPSEESLGRELSDREREIEVLINFERYFPIVDAFKSGKGEADVLSEVDSVLAAKLVRMHHLTQKEESGGLAELSEDSDESDESESDEDLSFEEEPEVELPDMLEDTTEVDSFGENYGILGYSKIVKFDAIHRHNRRALNLQRSRARVIRKKKLKADREARRRKEKLKSVPLPPPQKSAEQLIYLSSDSEEGGSSQSDGEGADDDAGVPISSSDLFGEEPKAAAQPHRPLRKPSRKTMEEFFPDLVPVCSKDEAMSWTEADFSRRRAFHAVALERKAEDSSLSSPRPSSSSSSRRIRDRSPHRSSSPSHTWRGSSHTHTRRSSRERERGSSGRRTYHSRSRSRSPRSGRARANGKSTKTVLRKVKVSATEKIRERMRLALKSKIKQDKSQVRRKQEDEEYARETRRREMRQLRDKYENPEREQSHRRRSTSRSRSPIRHRRRRDRSITPDTDRGRGYSSRSSSNFRRR